MVYWTSRKGTVKIKAFNNKYTYFVIFILTNNKKTLPRLSRYDSIGKAANRITAAMTGIRELIMSQRYADNQKLVM